MVDAAQPQSSRDNYDQWHRRRAEAEAALATVPLRQWHETVLRRLPDLNDCDVLEIGCGRGDFSLLLSQKFPRARITGVDFSGEAVAIASEKAAGTGLQTRFAMADAQSLEFPQESFDWIISCECMEHVPAPQRMAAEMLRVLRPGGKFILTTENYFNGMLLAWLQAYFAGKPFDSGSGVQPIEHFFMFWNVRRILTGAGLRVDRMESNHYQWLLLPRVDPARLCTAEVASPFLKRLFLPFGRHFTYAGHRPLRA